MSEYCIKAETKNGKVLMVRRGFVSRRAAEEYPVKRSLWARVWVELWAPPLPVKQRRRLSPHDGVNLCFEALANAALRGERCPENGSQNVNAARCAALAAAGCVQIEVFARNYRVVTILAGRHAGKKTAPPPYRVTQPKLVINKEGKHVFKRFDRGTRVIVQSASFATQDCAARAARISGKRRGA